MGALRTKKLVSTLKQFNEDFEWYPTTTEILNLVKCDLKGMLRDSEHASVLDCGAGDGRALKYLTQGNRYAIEKSKTLIDAMHRDIFIVGTEFMEQTLIDKRVNIVYSNPPYSEYEDWVVKILKEANCSYAYLVIPSRWKNSTEIQLTIESRRANYEVIGSFDFMAGDRPARANVDIVRFTLGSGYSGIGHTSPYVDPFRLWFNEHFKFKGAASSSSQHALKTGLRKRVKESLDNALVAGRDLTKVLEALYQKDMHNLLQNYQMICELDGSLLREMNVNLEGVKESLKLKVNGLKDCYWDELFGNLNRVTDRLTFHSRKSMLDVLNENTHVDFTAANAYGIVSWAVKNANKYFDDQLVSLVESMVSKANIINYVSNKKTFGDEDWRYRSKPSLLDKYKLDYRIVIVNVGGLSKEGISNNSVNLIDDIRTVASNLGLDCSDYPGAKEMDWQEKPQKKEFLCTDLRNGKEIILMDVKAYYNGNLHIRFDQSFLCRLNCEFGRLKGWLKSAKEAAEELKIKPEQASQSFKSNIKIECQSLLSLTDKSDSSFM